MKVCHWPWSPQPQQQVCHFAMAKVQHGQVWTQHWAAQAIQADLTWPADQYSAKAVGSFCCVACSATFLGPAWGPISPWSHWACSSKGMQAPSWHSPSEGACSELVLQPEASSKWTSVESLGRRWPQKGQTLKALHFHRPSSTNPLPIGLGC